MSKYTIDDIFKSVETKHSLGLFDKRFFSSIKLHDKKGKPYLKCFGSDKERPAKPEEIVRQLFIKKLIKHYGYPRERIQVEKDVWFGSGVSDKRADIVILQKDLEHPFIIVEVKKPNRRDGIEQLKSYCNAEGSPIGVWTNGSELVVLHREEPNVFTNISDIPTVDQSLQDVIKELWTLVKLTKNNKLVTEKLSLRKLIEDLEDLVLANAGVDAFEEVFKLIYAKLYDEWAAKNVRSRKGRIHFRIYGESPSELYEKINSLFNDAINKWKGVFSPMDKIELLPGHLKTCVSFLHDIKLFNSNLQVIDEAFEYLVTQVAKGAKGQYFTPRHVIDMAIRMLNHKETEKVIDTAAGSCGFTVHTIQYIAEEPTSPKGLPEHAREFAQNNIFGIDFDNRSVKIAKAINLIAGDGKSNVYKLNSLDSFSWDDEGKSAFRPMLMRFPNDRTKDDDNQKNFKYFDFDLLLTNPPFAGNIKEKQILKNYLLAEKKGKTVSNIGRDILFIERNLNFIRPGGRVAIVLPQGRLNNTNDEHIRRFIMERARILAVVGLHGNTFKPHTGTKTSLLFLQKYTEKEIENGTSRKPYPIFMATSVKSGKDNSGEYVFKKDDGGKLMLDDHDHLIVDHDLDFIADKFIEFAKKERFYFWKDSYVTSSDLPMAAEEKAKYGKKYNG